MRRSTNVDKTSGGMTTSLLMMRELDTRIKEGRSGSIRRMSRKIKLKN